MLQDVYTLPGIGNLIHNMLPIEDRLRMDCVSKEIRTFHREEVYPRTKSLNTELIMDDAESETSGMSYIKKASLYAEEIVCIPNRHELKLPALRHMPKVKRILYGITMTVDVTHYDISYHTSNHWVSVENLLGELAEDYDDTYPLENILTFPGIVRFIRTDPETGEEVESYDLDDQSEATHCAYYRRFGFEPIYIPWRIYRKDFHLHVPRYLAASVAQEQHREKITYWDSGEARSFGRLLLDFH